MKLKKILIIDDDPDIRFFLKKHLEHSGYRCICVSEVEKALVSLNKIKPNLVILDLGLKQADGTAFLTSAYKWLPQGSKIPPTIVLSGLHQKDIVNYCLEHGACGFIAKPHDREVLLSMVYEYIQ